MKRSVVVTEEEKRADLDRQLRLAETGELAGVFCPWCRKLDRPDMDDCCVMFTAEKDRRGQEQFKQVLDQYALCESGKADTIKCPYCLKTNESGNMFCCSLFAAAAAAIMERIEKADKMQSLVDEKKRIEDRMVN